MQEDQLVSSYYKTLDFYKKNKNVLLGGIIAIVVVIAGSFLYVNKMDSDRQEAATKMAKIMTTYESGDYQKAIEGVPGTNVAGLQTIADSYSGTEQGELASIYLAHSYYKLGKYDEAMNAYENYSGSDPLLKATALAGIGNCYVQKEQNDKAAEYFEDAASVSGKNVTNPENLEKAGINYFEAGNNEKAKEMFEMIATKYKNSPEGNEVEKYLSQLK